jgi:hypothetical protein
MSRYPASPAEIADEFVQDYQNLFNENLIAVIQYGSYTAKKTEINFMIVITETAMASIHRVLECVKKWQKRSVAVPLFVTEEYVDSSLDSFPLEFSNLQQAHQLLYGKDILAGLTISREHLRLQCEAQIKGKLLHLRAEFLATLGNAAEIRRLIRATVPAFTAVFKGLLSLKNIPAPRQSDEIVLKTVEAFSLDASVLTRVLEVGQGDSKATAPELIALCENYIAEIRKLAFTIDQIK